jgi:5-methylthioadenosine/S-adenosylhomocysteine deaminase
MLGPETLAIHAIDASRTEIGRLRDTGTSVAHCPKSNLKLGHAIAPLRELLDAGVAVGLGSDSVASNNAVDLFEEMRIAAFLQRTRFGDPTVISAAEVFRLATLGGARCLGLDRELGSLEAGKLADFVVLDLSDPGIEPVYDPIDAIVFSASRQNVRETFLGGERVAREGGEIVAPVRRIAARLRGRD